MAPQKQEDDSETASWEQDKTATDQEGEELVEEQQEENDFETASLEPDITPEEQVLVEETALLEGADEEDQQVEDELESASWEQDKRKP